jgi:hypothetical protein
MQTTYCYHDLRRARAKKGDRSRPIGLVLDIAKAILERCSFRIFRCGMNIGNEPPRWAIFRI